MNFFFLAYGLDVATYAAIASAVVGAAGTAYSYYQSNQQQKSIEAQGKANADAIAAEQARKNAEAAENMRRKAIEQKRFRASQAVDLVDSGFDTSTGTPLAIMADTIMAQQRELGDMGYVAANEQARLGWERTQALYGASQQSRAQGMQGTASLISGVGSAASNMYTVQQSRPRTSTTYGNSGG